MSNDKDSARAVATGLDFKLRENSDALIRYLTSSKKVALQYQPSVREDGSLVVYFSPSNGLSGTFETVGAVYMCDRTGDLLAQIEIVGRAQL
jgi:hypothetical protein